MSTELIQSLSNEPSRIQVEALLRGALREPAFAELDALLQAWIDEHPGPLTALCRDVGDVAVTGWDALDAEIATLAARGTLCSAVGIDLTGHHIGDGPGFEVSLYSDKIFAFSTSDRAAILAASENDGPEWQGCFEEIGHSLSCSGLEALHAAVSIHPQRLWLGDGEMSADYPDYFIGVWFLYLRVNQALAGAAEENRLPYPMPMLVSQHDFGPSFETVYMADSVVSVPAETLEEPIESEADWAEPAAPELVIAQFELPEIEIPEVELAEAASIEVQEAAVQTSPAVTTTEPPPSRGWPWRKSASRAVDSSSNAGEAPVTQRRRGPGSFATG